MRTINVKTKNDIRECVVYNINDFPYHKFIGAKTYRKKMGHDYVAFLDLACAFDIETTNIIPDFYYEKKGSSKIKIFKDNRRPYAFMYQWQFCIEDSVIFGRTWSEFTEFMVKLKNELDLNIGRRIVVYVHNLSFEFQFIKNFFICTDVFAKNNRMVLKCTLDTCYELRCSYVLSNMTLAKFCENTPNVEFYKNIDTYDYNKIRTFKTELTEEEESYCYCDVRGLCECIRHRLIEDDITSIPMTSTGYVRRDYRKAMAKNSMNRKKFIETQLDENLYIMMREAFRGGDTHANVSYVGETIIDITSFDKQSSYPSVMMLEKFPVGKFIKINSSTLFNKDLSKYAIIMRIHLENVKWIARNGNPYIAISKCTKISGNTKKEIGYVNDNGRVAYAKYLEMTVTDIDFTIIQNEYEFSDIYVKDIHISEYGKLNNELRETLMSYYRAKTELKGVDGQEYEYTKSKNKVNSGYGMMVTDIAREEWVYKNGIFIEEETNLKNALKKYYSSRNSFLSYQHGVWITAHARAELRKGINIAKRSNVYDDTDSVKFLTNEKIIAGFMELNKEIIEKCEKENAYAYDKDGKKQYLGVWDFDGHYTKFKTLGSKKYVYEHYDKNNEKEIVSTISGVSKKKGKKYFTANGIEAFKIGAIIEDSGNTNAYYNDVEKPYLLTVNGDTFWTGSNVAIENTCYEIGVTNEYLDIIQKGLENIISF